MPQSLFRRGLPWRTPPRRTETGRPILRAYLFALALIAAVVALKHIANTPLGYGAPFLFMLGSTVVVTWYGGRSAGLVAAVLGTLAVNYFFLPPYNTWHSTAAANQQTVLFGIENLLVAALTSMLVVARGRAEAGAERMRRLYAANSEVARARSVDDVAAIIARNCTEAMSAGAAAVFVPHEARPVLRVAGHFGGVIPAAQPAVPDSAREVPIEGPFPAAIVFRTGEPLYVGKAEELQARFPEFLALPRPGPPCRALAGVPIRLEGRTLGVLAFAYDRDRRFSEEDRVLASSLAQDCARAMERVRLFDAEHHARLEAEQANHAKDEFLGIVSHELRTPLTAIAGWMYLLKRSADAARRDHAVDVIERSLKAQTRIVEDILDVQQIVGHKLRVQPEPVDFAAAARSAVDELVGIATARGVELTVSSTGAVMVSGDAGRLRQMTENLVGNAIKFTPSGGHVQVDIQATQGRARLRVRDDGKGIAQEDLPLLFEPFRQVDSSPTRREGGLGLGLAIVRSLVEAHRGAVRLESPGLGLGTTAVVELPLLEEQAGPIDRGGAPALTTLRVLLVDDDPDALESTSAALVGAGAEVRMARSAVEALQELSGFAPDVLVSDISMPEHDGYWLIRKVRSMGTLSARVPAIATTAYGSAPNAKTAALAAGFQCHLIKPIDPELLASTIAELARPSSPTT
jgi:signal transduction histidine kinase/ActR/RegA family two-component response regulator